MSMAVVVVVVVVVGYVGWTCGVSHHCMHMSDMLVCHMFVCPSKHALPWYLFNPNHSTPKPLHPFYRWYTVPLTTPRGPQSPLSLIEIYLGIPALDSSASQVVLILCFHSCIEFTVSTSRAVWLRAACISRFNSSCPLTGSLAPQSGPSWGNG